MAKMSKVLLLFILLIAGIATVLGSLVLTQQSFFGGTVLVPVFGRIECVGSNQFLDLGKIKDVGSTYNCPPAGAFTFDPCVYSVEAVGWASSSLVEDCDQTTSSCKKLYNWASSSIPKFLTIQIQPGRQLHINPDTPFAWDNDASPISVTYQQYRLEQIELGHKVYGTDCAVSNLNKLDVLPDEKIESNQIINDYKGTPTLKKGEIVNYIIGSVPITDSKNVVTIAGINNGQPIDVIAPGTYYPVVKSDKGTYYVDSRQVMYNSNLQCTPATPYCEQSSTGTKVVVQPTGQTCTALSGVSDSYTPISDTKSCKLQCTGGVTSITSDCVTRIDKCPADKPVFNVATNSCVTLVAPPADEGFDFNKALPWITAIIFIVVILVIALVYKNPKGKKAKK